MSKITNDGLTRSGCQITYTVLVETLNPGLLNQ